MIYLGIFNKCEINVQLITGFELNLFNRLAALIIMCTLE